MRTEDIAAMAGNEMSSEEQRMGYGKAVDRGAGLEKVAGEGLSKEVTFVQRPKGGEGGVGAEALRLDSKETMAGVKSRGQ